MILFNNVYQIQIKPMRTCKLHDFEKVLFISINSKIAARTIRMGESTLRKIASMHSILRPPTFPSSQQT